MKKRTFFVMLILFLVFLNSTILLISLITLNDNLSTAQEKCLAEHYVIASALMKDMQALEQREADIKGNMDKLMRPYSRYLQGRRGELAVVCSGEWIYKSSEAMLKDNSIDPENINTTQERVIFMKNLAHPVICVYGNFPAPWQDYGLMYIGDVSDMFSAWKHMKNLLFFIGMVVMLIMAVVLFKFLDIIFRPLRQISITSAQIANGDYGRRLPVQGKDEVASMACNFNLMAEQVETQIRQLRENAVQKQQFIDNFAHELRIPLTAVYGYAEYIQKASISEEEHYECTQFIMSECKRLQNMAYQLLDLALLREIEMEDCPVDTLFAQSERMMYAKAEEKKIKLSYILQNSGGEEDCGMEGLLAYSGGAEDRETERLLVWGNREQLLSLVNNLIDNAVKASSPGSEVIISAYLEKNYIVVKVKDYGIGMSPEQLTHIKEAFYRVDKARSRAGGGAGLGLSICERIAHLHHAEFTFASEPGKGTTARLCFPKTEKSFTSQK